MSNLCTCHIDMEHCFYCDTYIPTVKKAERLAVEVTEQKTRTQEAEDLVGHLQAENARLRRSTLDLLNLIDRGYLYPTKMSSAVSYVVRLAREALKDAAS